MRLRHLSIVTIALLMTIGCGKAAAPEAPAEKAGEETSESQQITLSEDKAKEGKVETALVQVMPIQAELKVAGTIASTAKGRAIVSPPVSGKILRLLVGPGDQVHRGQSLAVIESPDLAQAQTAIAEAERLRVAAAADVQKSVSESDLAKSRLRTAQEQLVRQTALVKAGVFSQPTLQAAQKELSEAQGDLDSAKRDLDVHRIQLERAEKLFKQELIARTELEQARLAVAQDEVRVRKAQSRVGTAESALRREQDISTKGLLNVREIQTAEADVRAAKLDVQRAQIALAASRSALAGAEKAVANGRSSYTAIRGSGNTGDGNTVSLSSPLDGTVTERKATIGQAVERASELFEIENLKTIWVTAHVPEKEISKIQLGLQVRVAVAAFPGQIFRGTVQLLGNHLDSKTRTMPVQCLVQNPKGILREDMFANVFLGIGPSSRTLAIPDEAISRKGDETSVFVVTGDKYERRAVELGRTSEGNTEVLSGLKQGERIVTKGLFIVESESRKGELKGEE